jgi:RNA polymerase sigma-70 factor, ECF subfamily
LLFKKNQNFRIDDLDSIIAACLLKDQQAERALVKLFYSFVKGIAMRYAANTEEAEEIINDGFLKVFNNLVKYDHAKPFKGWLRTIVVNTAIDYYRKSQKYSHPVDIDDVDVPDMNEDVISKISADEILSLVQQLPPSYRTVFTLYVIDGYNHREIADMLGIKEGTSKSNLQDARKKLQVLIKKEYPNLYLAYGLKINKINEN